MKYNLLISKDRVSHLVDILHENIIVKEDKGDLIDVDIIINNDIDLLGIFHAGISVGHEMFKNKK